MTIRACILPAVLLSVAAYALPAPHDQVSDYIWRQGANLPRHEGVGDKKLRVFGYELDSFPTEQDAYFEYGRLIPVTYPIGDTAWHEWRDDDGRKHIERGKIFGTVTKYEPDRGKGGKQNYTVECILEKCYGDAYEEQMIRALSARTLQFGDAARAVPHVRRALQDREGPVSSARRHDVHQRAPAVLRDERL